MAVFKRVTRINCPSPPRWHSPMHPLIVSILPLLLLLVTASAVALDASPAVPSASEVFAAQTKKFNDAVKNGDRRMLMRIFRTRDEKNDKVDAEVMMLKYHQLNVSLTGESAKYLDANTIEGVVKYTRASSFKRPFYAKFLITKSYDSPTGWQFVKVEGSGKPRSIEFTTCFIGIFWCVIEYTIRAADGEFG